MLYIHDTLELFGDSLPHLRQMWAGTVRPALARRALANMRAARQRVFTDVTDTVREAALMATGRHLSPRRLLEVCAAGLNQVLE